MSKSYKPIGTKYINTQGVTHDGNSLYNMLNKNSPGSFPNIMCNRRSGETLTGRDLNTIIHPGIYALYGSNTNVPTGSVISGGFGTLEVTAYSSAHIVQILHESTWAADGNNIWYRFGSTGSGVEPTIWSSWRKIIYEGDMSKTSLSNNGYTQLSNGLIIQWGRVTGTGNKSFPKPFPTACCIVIAGRSHAGDSNPHYITLSGVVGWDRSSFYIVSGGYISMGNYQTDLSGDYYRGAIVGMQNFGGPTDYIAIGY